MITTDVVKEVLDLEEEISKRSDQFPLLAKCKVEPCKRLTIEFPVNGEMVTNYTQINRFPYTGPVEQGSLATPGSCEMAEEDQILTLLSVMEHTVEHGKPGEYRNSSGMMLQTCGGFRHFLGRELTDRDEIVIRPLADRGIIHRKWDSGVSRDWGEPYEAGNEFLTEFTVEIRQKA